jgi:hypothetical protein
MEISLPAVALGKLFTTTEVSAEALQAFTSIPTTEYVVEITGVTLSGLPVPAKLEEGNVNQL